MANAVPGAVRLAEAATIAVGVVARWQASQAVEEGMWAPAPAGLVAGMPMIAVMPANELALPAGWWQATQLPVMRRWLISDPLKRAPLPTGTVATDEPVPTWQTSQDSLVGMWLVGSPTIAKLAEGMAKEAAVAPWHWAQFPVVLGA